MNEPFPARRQVDLANLDWHLGPVAQRTWRPQSDGAPYDLPQVPQWLPAIVPGNVRSDLLAADRIPDPFVADGLEAGRWTEGFDWWYRAQLPLGIPTGQRAFLELDGVDYLSAVFAEARELGRHEGMFSRQVYEIPQALVAGPDAELAIRIWGSNTLPGYNPSPAERAWGLIAGRLQGGFPAFDDRLAVIKAPMHFGWDFAPRLRTMGIWDDVRLIVCDGVYLADVWVRAEPLALPADPGPARLQVQLRVDSDIRRSVIVRLRVQPHHCTGNSLEFEFPLDLPAGGSTQSVQCDLPAARLWQPWERGEPCLYDLAVMVYPRSAAGAATPEPPLDTTTVRFGVRRIERRLTDDGQRWQVVVNGNALFLRGANWVPVNALPGQARRNHYEPLLAQALEAGVNFLRIWGGGGREKRHLYDLCDERGLLVWQEFPIACVFLDRLPRCRRYLQLLRREATGIVRALRNHPSLFLWCGGNEFSPTRNRPAVEVLAQVVAQEDGSRAWVPSSPGAGDAHNWDVWHGREPFAAYRRERAALVSEFGLQAAPAASSLRRFLSPQELWPPGAGWRRHKADLEGLGHYAAAFERAAEGDNALQGFVAASQRAQAAAVQIMVEHQRRRKGKAGGVAVWQWNEPWPAISWSLIDYYGRPKTAYETLQRCFQPLLVCLDLRPRPRYRPGDRLQGALWLVNDSLEAIEGCRVVVLLDDAPVYEQCGAVGANAATQVGQLAFTLPARFERLRLELWQGNKRLASNVYDLRFHQGKRESHLRALRRRAVDLVLR